MTSLSEASWGVSFQVPYSSSPVGQGLSMLPAKGHQKRTCGEQAAFRTRCSSRDCSVRPGRLGKRGLDGLAVRFGLLFGAWWG